MMKCTYCDKEAIYYRKYSGEYLCKKHFIKSIEDKVRRNIRSILRPDIRIGLAVSGGKDSLSMAYIIKKITSSYSTTELLGIIVDEGIPGYRDNSIKAAVKTLEKLDIGYEIGSIEEYYDFKLVDIINEENRSTACTYCGVFRRRILDILSRKNNVDYLFTGHNASDFAQTVLLNVIQGNLKYLTSELKPNDITIPRIYPLRYILEKEVTLYAYLRKIEYYDKPCPFTRFSLRNDIRNFLTHLEKQRPGITYNIVRLGDKLKKMGHERYILKPCKLCGFPTTREICKVCELLKKIGKDENIIRLEDIK